MSELVRSLMITICSLSAFGIVYIIFKPLLKEKLLKTKNKKDLEKAKELLNGKISDDSLEFIINSSNKEINNL